MGGEGEGKIAMRRATLLAALGSLVLGSALVGAGEPGGAGPRKMRFSAADQTQAVAWQEQSRRKLFELLKLSDLVKADLGGPDGKPALDFKVEVKKTSKDEGGKFTRYDLEISSTPTRRIPVVLTVPVGEGRFPAVVCIHGHGGSRDIVYDPGSIYHGFALELAKSGCVTISTDVGQHDVYEKDRTLMGERLWDVMRCASYLTTRPEVDAGRIGCAGLSLGGEMAMWLGAMDPRIKATVSSGFLCYQKNMLQGHCLCWDFPGLRENFDWPDIYALTAPRPLMCQNGKRDGIFPWKMAEEAMAEVQGAYRCFGRAEGAVLQLHEGEHVFDTKPGVEFLEKALAK
jgi:hypothetical protein